MSARSSFRRMIRLFGYDIAKKGHVPHWDNFFDQIERFNLTPNQVFDIGVGYGTPALYDRFPHAELYLFDPSPSSAAHASEVTNQRENATFFPVALGSASKDAPLITPGDNFEASSFYSDPGDASALSYMVQVKRFDSLIPQIKYPSLCKIDAQGYEVEILLGMGELARVIDFYIIETTLQKSHSSAPEFSDVQSLMMNLGFSLFEIGGFIRRPRDEALAQIDAIYVKDDCPLRADRRWTHGRR